MTEQPLTASAGRLLTGRIAIPGDKSISHRALILGALASGETEITGLLESDDVLATAEALRALGVPIRQDQDEGGSFHVLGRGTGGLCSPDRALDFGNSGTGARLMMGVIASHCVTAHLTGDASLSSRPMKRVLEPLAGFGAQVKDGRSRLPLTLSGASLPVPVTYELPVPSAQVKSAVLLAGLNTRGTTCVIEPVATRDHTERMLKLFGADVTIENRPEGGLKICVTGEAELEARHIVVPGDPSSAAFPAVAALIVPGSDIIIQNVMMNPARSGLYTTLSEMGGQIDFLNPRQQSGEVVVDMRVRASALHGIKVPAERAPSMIDEYPALAIAAACAAGETRMEGLGELKVKESDRLSAIYQGLGACGVACSVQDDVLVVKGGGDIAGGGVVQTRLDHRIAMAFLVLGLVSKAPVQVDDGATIMTSFPGFVPMMQELGANITA
jgi:3-phosphoshikimate 1-carboxyvinyltransferase